MNDGSGSAVVDTMRDAANAAWKEWRRHVAAGTASTPEGIAAFDASQEAAATLIGEVAARRAAQQNAAGAQ